MRSLILAAFMIMGFTPAQAVVFDTFALPTTGPTILSTTVTSNQVLALGTSYTIEVSGTFPIGCGNPCPADAEYYLFSGLPYDNTGLSNTPGVGVDVGATVNGVKELWGPYTPTNIYTLAFLGLGSTIDMGYSDSNYGDNILPLSVRILTSSTTPPSAVPVPAAFWLFGTALIGFIGISRRTKVA